MEKIDKIRDTFGTSEGFVPKLSQFTLVSVEEIQKIVLKSPSKSCMLDHIPTSLLKECKSELMPIITKIVNLSIETGACQGNLNMQKEGFRAYLQKLSPCIWITLLIQSH